ncbi:MAG TPA: AraC family transcriptional regulator [Clostridia bacterium]|nr:AraC family transcriptional regulator [Clostridia bacterium]
MSVKLLKLDTFTKSPKKEWYISKSVFTFGERTILHNHDFYEIFFVQSGVCLHYKNNKLYSLPEKSVQFVFPEDIHCFSSDGRGGAVIVNIAFSKAFFQQFKSDFFNGIKDKEAFMPAIPNQNWSVIMDKLEWFSRSDARHSDLLQSILFDFIYLYEMYLAQQSDMGLVPSWLQNARKQMKKDENLSVGLKRLVEISGRSQEYVTRQMKKYYNQTPTQWINHMRLEKAKDLLLLTDMPVLEIIYESGFQNEAYFYSLFKKEYSQSPKAFREQNRRMFLK